MEIPSTFSVPTTMTTAPATSSITLPPYLTVTYGEWYGFHDVASLDAEMSLTSLTSVCPV